MNDFDKRAITLRNSEWKLISELLKIAGRQLDDTGVPINQSEGPLYRIAMAAIEEFERQRNS